MKEEVKVAFRVNIKVWEESKGTKEEILPVGEIGWVRGGGGKPDQRGDDGGGQGE